LKTVKNWPRDKNSKVMFRLHILFVWLQSLWNCIRLKINRDNLRGRCDSLYRGFEAKTSIWRKIRKKQNVAETISPCLDRRTGIANFWYLQHILRNKTSFLKVKDNVLLFLKDLIWSIFLNQVNEQCIGNVLYIF
jgi:hypothetical protein